MLPGRHMAMRNHIADTLRSASNRFGARRASSRRYDTPGSAYCNDGNRSQHTNCAEIGLSTLTDTRAEARLVEAVRQCSKPRSVPRLGARLRRYSYHADP